MDAAAELGRNTVSTRFSVSIENEQADTIRDSQTCLAKPSSQARTGAWKIFPVQLSIDRIGNLTRLICTLLYVMTTHAYVYTVACTLNSRLLSRHPGVVAGTLRGSLLGNGQKRELPVLFGQKRMYPKKNAAESVVGRI